MVFWGAEFPLNCQDYCPAMQFYGGLAARRPAFLKMHEQASEAGFDDSAVQNDDVVSPLIFLMSAAARQSLAHGPAAGARDTPRPRRYTRLAWCQQRSAAHAPAPAPRAGPLSFGLQPKRSHPLAKGVTARHPLGNAIWALRAGPA
jgi:hypothetical protein